MDTKKEADALKTIKAGGTKTDPGQIENDEREIRSLFGVESRGGIELSSGRGEGTVTLSGVQPDDVVELVLDDDIYLFSRRDDLEHDFSAELSRGADPGDLVFRSLRFGAPSRGGFDWAIKIINLFHVDIAEKAGLAICQKFEKKSVPEPGLKKVEPSDSLVLRPAEFGNDFDTTKPILVFIHGTASNTNGSFGGIWEKRNAGIRNALFDHYENRVYALEHHTLSVSPIKNAIELVKALPPKTTVHLVSHSRGGIVGELACRSMVNDGNDPFLPLELEAYYKRASAIAEDMDEGQAEAMAAYEAQIEKLKELNSLLKGEESVKFTKFVRVACPARGTTLASGRLDRWLSIIFNLVNLIPAIRATPYYALLKNFIRALVKTRTKPEQLPGLEAQMPRAPLIGLLNGSDRQLNSDLSVIAGDIEGDGILGRIALLLPDQFYDTDHDLVVNTPSMYGGSIRASGERYFFDRGTGVSHFNYFRNDETALRIIKGLTLSGEALREYFTSHLPEPEGAIPSRSFRHQAGPQPVIFILPGIMGSELDVRTTTIWANKFKLMLGGMSKLEITDPDVAPSGLMHDTYWNLVEYLSHRNEVIPFPYDWRTSLIDEAGRLADAVRAKVQQATAENQPVSLLAHSMGGLLARVMMVKHPDVWEAMLTHTQSRLVMLGTPNGGSFSIPRMLLGHDKLVKGLALIDLAHSLGELLQIISRYPGALFLLPFGDERYDFFSEETWRELSQTDSKAFAAPDPAQLAKAREVRTLINTRPLALEASGRILYVAGHAKETPVALVVEKNTPVFKGTPRGDGRVPWDTGIPTGIPTWYMDVKHGDLANHIPAFEAISELIQIGNTDRLPRREPAIARGIPDQFDLSPDEIQIYPGEKELKAWALEADVETGRPPQKAKTRLRITHGNLAFSSNPVMVGHYLGDGLFSAERYLDKCLDGQLARCHRLDLYPGPLNSAELIMSKEASKPRGALIVGLGEVGKLTLPTLSQSISKALHRYAFDIAKYGNHDEQPSSERQAIAITSLLVGASTGGLSLPDVLLALMEGVIDANKALLDLDKTGSGKFINELQIIELWEDRAILAARTLEELFDLNSELSDAFHYDGTLEQVAGGQTRAYYEAEPGWWNRLQIQEMKDGSLNFHSISDRARTEKRLLAVDRDKVDQFLRGATASTWTNRELPKTLFEMLIPNELKDTSDKLGDTVLMIDEQTAQYPWELMEDRFNYSGKPLAVQNRIIRQLESLYFRHKPKMALENLALVVGEPRTTLNRLWSPLPGAAEEAQLVAGLLGGEGRFSVSKLIQVESGGILKAVYEKSYRVMHLAGHGVHAFNLHRALDQLGLKAEAQKAGENVSGMVIGDTVFLNSYDVEQMRRVPELVFINCCYLGRTNGTFPREGYPALAANLATQFIRMGACAVVAAGWQVDDAAAKTFANVFYTSMISGQAFGEAVYEARKEVYDRHGEVNTWGAYQCYGDPQYTLTGTRSWSSQAYERPQTPYDLVVRVNNLGQAAATDTDSKRKDRLAQLEAYVDRHKNPMLKKWEKQGDVCAAVGKAYGEFDRFDEAIAWYQKASATEDASVSIRAFEQYANLQARQAVAGAKAGLTKQEVDAAGKQIKDAVELLDQLDTLATMMRAGGAATTVERACLRGSAYKRLALIRAMAGEATDKVVKELKTMQKHYKEASDLYREENHGKINFYPYANYLTATTIMRLLSGRFQGLSPEEKKTLEKVKKDAELTDQTDPSFWSMVSGTDCTLIAAINDGTLEHAKTRIVEGYLAAKKRSASPREFRSITESIEALIHLINAKPGTTTSRNRRTGINATLVEIKETLLNHP